MTNFYTSNDWETVYCWAVNALSDDKTLLLELIADDNAFNTLYCESYQDCGSGVDNSTDVWHCGNYGKVMAMTSGRASCAFDLIERLIMEFADNGLDFYKLGDSDYVFKFYTDKLVEAVYKDLCDDNNKGLKAIIDDDEDDSKDCWSVQCYNPDDDQGYMVEAEEYFENTDLGKEKAMLHYDKLVDSGEYGAIYLVHYIDGDGDHVRTWERDGDEAIEADDDDKCATHKVKCWTCDDKCATHKVFRDALNEYEYTCDECYENEYGDKEHGDED